MTITVITPVNFRNMKWKGKKSALNSKIKNMSLLLESIDSIINLILRRNRPQNITAITFIGANLLMPAALLILTKTKGNK